MLFHHLLLPSKWASVPGSPTRIPAVPLAGCVSPGGSASSFPAGAGHQELGTDRAVGANLLSLRTPFHA